MKAKISIMLGTMALAASTLSAQNPFQSQFKLTGTLAGAPNFNGDIVSPYVGAFAPFAPLDNQLAWCVDLNTNIHIPSASFDVWVTPLTSSNFSHTAVTGATPTKAEYQWAAYLANYDQENFINQVVFPGNASGDTFNNNTDATLIQEGIWGILGENSTDKSDFTGSSLATTMGISGATDFTTGPGNGFDGSDLNLADWALVSCKPNVVGGEKGNLCPTQEFLVFNAAGFPQGNTTPEPASLSLIGTGLAGVLGMGMKRRKRNS